MTTAAHTAHTTIETLALNLIHAAESNVYVMMQKILKTARDVHHLALEVACNKSIIVLKQECLRLSAAITNGTVQEHKPKAKAKSKRPSQTTHTIDKQEQVAPASEPKQVALELQLAEALASIAALRLELADKTNEVAEYAEALAHSRETIANQAATIRELQEQPTEADEWTEEPAAEVEETQEDTVVSDAIDDLMLLLQQDSERDLGLRVVAKVAGRLGEKRGREFIEAFDSITFVSYDLMSTAIRNLCTTYRIKLEWIDAAITIERAL